MKKALLFLSILLGVTLATQAQKQKGQGKMASKSPEEVATAISNKMTTKYTLNDDQKAKVYQASLTKTNSVRAIRAKYPNAASNQADKKAMHKELKPLKDSYKAELKGIMTAEQYAQFEKDVEAKKAQMKEKKKGQGKGKSQASGQDATVDEIADELVD